jgi:hypothetical protein
VPERFSFPENEEVILAWWEAAAHPIVEIA